MVPRIHFDIVENDRYTNYSWGKKAFKSLAKSLSKKMDSIKKFYRICGMPIALQVWIYECSSSIDLQIARKVDDRIPRLLNWETVESTLRYQKLMKDIFNDTNKLNFKNISPNARELAVLQLLPEDLQNQSDSSDDDLDDSSSSKRNSKRNSNDHFQDTPPPSCKKKMSPDRPRPNNEHPVKKTQHHKVVFNQPNVATNKEATKKSAAVSSLPKKRPSVKADMRKVGDSEERLLRKKLSAFRKEVHRCDNSVAPENSNEEAKKKSNSDMQDQVNHIHYKETEVQRRDAHVAMENTNLEDASSRLPPTTIHVFS